MQTCRMRGGPFRMFYQSHSIPFFWEKQTHPRPPEKKKHYKNQTPCVQRTKQSHPTRFFGLQATGKHNKVKNQSMLCFCPRSMLSLLRPPMALCLRNHLPSRYGLVESVCSGSTGKHSESKRSCPELQEMTLLVDAWFR